MGRRAGCSSQRGLLLVEAVLSAVVIAVGLVFISRGLTSQLRALRTVEEHEVLLSLAHRRLGELEAERLADLPPTQGPPEGSFEMPDEASSDVDYRWTVTGALRDDLEADADGRPLFSEITLTVRRGDEVPVPPAGGGQAGERRSSAVTLSAIWPTGWVPAEWYH